MAPPRGKAALPLKRLLQQHIANPLSVDLLGSVFTQFDTVIVYLDHATGKLVFRQLGQAIPAEFGPVKAR